MRSPQPVSPFFLSVFLLVASLALRGQTSDIGLPPEYAQPASRAKFAPQSAPAASWYDTSNRNTIRDSWNLTFVPTLSVPMGWAGDVASGNPGTSTQGFKDAVAARINWFRAMAGVPPGVTIDPVYSAKDQQAAMMFSVNRQISHTPPSTWINYTADGATAAANSDICLGYSDDPGCVQAYVLDLGSNNVPVGHRRWILYPQTQLMGTGDVPQSGPASNPYPPTNALWVFDGHFGDPRPATRDGFVAWPPPGYVPYQEVGPRWSISYPNADFSNAQVAMQRNGASVPVVIQPITNGYGENTLVWVPENLNTSTWHPLAPAADTTTSVTVSNVLIAGVPKTFTYTVTSFDPATLSGATFTFVPTTANIGASGGSGSSSLQVTPSSATWSASSDSSWLTLSSTPSGTGSSTIAWNALPNSSSHDRSGIITAGGATLTLTEAGQPCVFTLPQTSGSLPASGGSGSFIANFTPTDCGYSYSWSGSVTINPVWSAGAITVNYMMPANPGAARNATVLIGGKTFTISQASVSTPAPAAPPFGTIDTPGNHITGVTGAIGVTGWALSSSGIAKIQFWRDPVSGEPVASNGLVYLADATIVPGARPDVAQAYPNYPGNSSGFGGQILTNQLPSSSGAGLGNGAYGIHVIALGNSGLSTDLGVRAITTDNAHAIVPFGTIDTPGQGATVSGTVVNFGWVVTPNPASVIPKDGSTIWVYIDNQPVAHPVYNNYRSDIAGLFPGLANSNGAVGYYLLDSTKLSNGLHTISWTVTDNAGQAQGIGSRFFNIQN